MDKPFAITLDVGLLAGQQDRLVAHVAPVYVDRLPPCNSLPGRRDIQGWLYHAESGDYEAAWRHLTRDNPFPAIMGRVCYHPARAPATAASSTRPVGINSVERFLGDEAIRRGWAFDAPAAGERQARADRRRRAVGPVGAATLRRLGHAVTVREAGPLMGGMMRFGIPKYRLPREVLDAEMQRIVAMGVAVKLGEGQHLEAPCATAASMRPSSPSARTSQARDHPGRRFGARARCVSVLRSMEGEDKPMLGRRVVVYGGGNTAIDVARTAKRPGRHRGGHRLPPHPREGCRPTTSRSRRRCRKA